MKKIAALIVLSIGIFSSIRASGQIPAAFDKTPNVVVITEFTTGTHAGQYIEGMKQEAESLGFHLEIMDAKNKREAMPKMLNDALLRNVDGIMISHGDPQPLLKGVERALNKQIPVVAFDCEFSLPAVVKIDQDDAKIAELGLKKIIEDTNGSAKLVHIWVPGFAPMEKRMAVYQQLMPQYPGIVEVERFGEATNTTALSTQVKMKAILEKYPTGTLDVVWATWNEFAKGAAKAIMEAGRSEIKLYGIDISDEDLAILQDQNSPWIATVGVDPKMIGIIQVRILAHKIAGQDVPERYSLPPMLVTREMLPKDTRVTMATLSQYVPGWGETQDFLDPWMRELKKKQAAAQN